LIKIGSLRPTIHDLIWKNHIIGLRRQLDQVTTPFDRKDEDEQVDEPKKQINDLQKQNSESKNKIDNLEKQNDKLRQENDNLKQQVDESEGKIDGLQAVLNPGYYPLTLELGRCP
jgi:chromosome segregation ATPase